MGQITNLKILWSFIAISTIYSCVGGISFNRNTTGVTFSAYVRSLPSYSPPYLDDDWTKYALRDVKTMLKVILQKFSKVATFGSGARNVRYQENVTYYQSFSQVYTGEAAAMLNQEFNANLLSIQIGVWIWKDLEQMNTEVQLALESTQKANTIYPGTVTGLIFSENNIATNIFQAKRTLSEIQKIKSEAENVNLKIGSRQNCNSLGSLLVAPENSLTDPLTKTRKQILQHSDFLICVIDSTQYDFSLEASIGFEQVTRDLLILRESIKAVNPNFEVMVQTGYSTAGSTVKTFNNLRKYYSLVDSWASENNFTVWMNEAFDNPWKHWDPWAAHFGWWKLKSNDKVDNMDGYLEKETQIPTKIRPTRRPRNDNRNETITQEGKVPMETNTSPWTYVGIAIGLFITLVILIQLGFFWRRFNKLSNFLTQEEVKQFLYGFTEENSIRKVLRLKNEHGPIETEALIQPYDKSFEIPKSGFQIAWSSLLGSGAFGCVYKAFIVIMPNREPVEVALKMTKDNCPKTAIKSLLSEIKILTYLGNHPNLVSIKGAYTAEMARGIVYVATELCELGSLKNYLRDWERCSNLGNNYSEVHRNAKPVDFKEMIRWSYEIACGMEYLVDKHVVHADLATRNVLLTGERKAKITDFGLSRRLYDYTNYVKKQQEPLPWRWMAIESLKKLEFSSQSDVWSYGITLWEIFSMGDVPYPGLSRTLDFVEKLENGLRMNSPSNATLEIYNLMSSCWNTDSMERPTFFQLKQSLARILKCNM